ncbi:hypothetical protein BJF79_23505 [Actinomadura sp. CNU-125]|uniref:hypothetical protein n=1 Tax=Actinomadura sp. CNU-125 TaxID=1904961 RepID=UPI0009635A04|nr:hypothetical protein [Actinomadura sp. CNU-125]OLT11787.1 hypothetical protein BJF79_23505 [Actinomadura sp. CNU-125]
MSRSEALLEACAEPLERAAAMRFAEDVRTGAIGAPEFADYLEIEASFVATAARLHGWRSGTRRTRRPSSGTRRPSTR